MIQNIMSKKIIIYCGIFSGTWCLKTLTASCNTADSGKIWILITGVII
jgi:hypothetical protein